VEFQSRGVRALVLLHEREMKALLAAWRIAKARGVTLPATEDPDYASLDHLLRHILRAGRGYLTWTCEVLGRAEPGVPTVPEIDHVETEADSFLEVVLAAWRTHLTGLTDEIADGGTAYLSRWNHPYTIDAMLEHAVVHPMRHRLQLEELIAAKVK
jgi:uncharacterized damage-inducible protein DinB